MVKRGGDIKARILEAAGEVFSRGGFGGARMEAIARLAGVNKAAIYYHLGDKARLYELVLVSRFRNVAETLERTLDQSPDPAARLDSYVRALAALFSRDLTLPSIMIQELAGRGRTLPGPVLSEMTRILRCTARALGVEGPAASARDLRAVLAHLVIVGSLVFTCLTRPVREKLARAVPAAFGRDLDIEDMVAFLVEMFGRPLGPGLEEGA
ncbi:MAG: TetR/AcrR family transcriptional regulator [Desulfovibrionaceae bacterium]|nr:TetR/AcrR family transcriptional regulator [Desulfovibrionaceae bacterium]